MTDAPDSLHGQVLLISQKVKRQSKLLNELARHVDFLQQIEDRAKKYIEARKKTSAQAIYWFNQLEATVNEYEVWKLKKKV